MTILNRNEMTSIEGFTVAEDILVVGQAGLNLQ